MANLSAYNSAELVDKSPSVKTTNAFNEHNTRVIMVMDVIIIIFSLMSIVLHLLGSYALNKIYRKQKRTAQKLYIMNLSLLEALRGLLNTFLVAIPLFASNTPTKLVWFLQHHMAIISEIPLAVLYYMAMIYLTIDRLLAIILGLKYHITSISLVSYVKILLIVTCSFCVILGVTFNVLHDDRQFYYSPYHFYVYLALDVFFVVLAVITYITIFRKYLNSLAIKERKKLLARKRKASIFEICRPYSNFYVSILLITNFLLLIVTPDLVHVTMIVVGKPPSSVTAHALLILNVLSDVLDACFYIFLQRNVRQMVCQIFHPDATTKFATKFVCRCRVRELQESVKSSKTETSI